MLDQAGVEMPDRVASDDGRQIRQQFLGIGRIDGPHAIQVVEQRGGLPLVIEEKRGAA
jgi:hypothetical protein